MGLSIKDLVIKESAKKTEMINEAVKLSRVLPNGGTVEDVLVDVYKENGEEIWSTKGIQHILDKYGMVGRTVKDLFYDLRKDGYIESAGVGKSKFTDLGIQKLDLKNRADKNDAPSDLSPIEQVIVDIKDDKVDIETTATTVKDLGKGAVTKLKIPTAKAGDKLEKFLETVSLHMMGNQKGKLLLTGDPGTGKSKTVETVMSLLKMQVITIEAPHTSEESVISIPYLVRRGTDVEVGVDQYKGGKDEMSYEVVNAESALITKLKRTLPIKDTEYNMFLNNNKLLKPLAEKYAPIVDELTKTYKTVLFLDEFYRTGSLRIQNLFRTILNGRIGTTPIPDDVYIIFASNMDNSDGSLDDIPLNHQFNKVNFDKPSKDDFMRYIADKFTDTDVNTGGEDDNKVENPISDLVYNKFVDTISNDDIGVKDSKGIRISPRRWEEIIKYINANIPPKNKAEAIELLTFLRDNMKDYESGDVSELYPKYKKMLAELIKESANIDISSTNPLPADAWRGSLDSQIRTKMKLGSQRKYVPIVSGAPGIGKTTVVDGICKKYGLKKIEIDCSTLNSDDVIGLTVPEGNGKELTTQFSLPPLYTKIMNEYDPKYEVKGSKYTHILFLDEISRVTNKVFNSIRSLMLDKKVGEFKIPDNIMIICAMNPTDKGTIVLSDHMKDVVDVIDSEPNYGETKAFFMTNKPALQANEVMGFDIFGIVLSIHDQIVELFESKEDVDGNPIKEPARRKFFWTDGLSTVYVSPREYDDMINGGLMNAINLITKFPTYLYDKNKSYTKEDIERFVNAFADAIQDNYEKVVGFIAVDKGQLPQDSMDKFVIGISSIIEKNKSYITQGMSELKSDALQTFKSIFEGANYDLKQILDYDGIGPLLESILDSADTDSVIADMSDILDYIKVTNTLLGQVKSIVDIWRIMKTVNWDNYNNDITSSMSDIFMIRGLEPLLEMLKTSEFDSETNTYVNPEVNEIANLSGDYDDDLMILGERAITNRYNMFF